MGADPQNKVAMPPLRIWRRVAAGVISVGFMCLEWRWKESCDRGLIDFSAEMFRILRWGGLGGNDFRMGQPAIGVHDAKESFPMAGVAAVLGFDEAQKSLKRMTALLKSPPVDRVSARPANTGAG